MTTTLVGAGAAGEDGSAAVAGELVLTTTDLTLHDTTEGPTVALGTTPAEEDAYVSGFPCRAQIENSYGC